MGTARVAAAAEEEASCAVDKHEGFSDADADGVEQIVCRAVREAGRSGRFRVHLGKLGSKVILTLVERAPDGDRDEQVILSGLDEVSVAAPRLVEASAEQKPVAETVTVNNVVGEETRTPKKRASHVHAWMGMIGAGGAGAIGAGANLAISAGSERWSFVGDLRLAGDAFNKPASVAGAIVTLGAVDVARDGDADFSYASLTGGARHHFAGTDFSPFAGLGLGVDFIARKQTVMHHGGYVSEDLKGKAGLAGYAEIGLDLMRTHVVGGAITLRADMPAFAVEERKPDPTNDRRYLQRSTYSPIFSAGFALRF
ncbi:MAG: hypothetical protein KIT84_22765 [Labilithrix sp.]|nr:hypothetical protein [Labilithrix sp.]MCW5813868.1 hypothetical protein [Labilithrix sp.]